MTFQARTETFKLKPYHALDSYKLGHPPQYPDDTRQVYSNFTPRSDRLANIPDNLHDGKLVWVGIQGTLMEYVNLWQEEFFDKPLEEVLAAFQNRVPAFTGSDADTTRLTALHKLGYLPLHVKSLPEGSRVNMNVPCFTMTNTHPDFGWLTNSTETYLSNESWKLPTVATIAHAYRTLLNKYAELTGTPLDFVDWQGHCFADRGMSGMMDAAKACAGHAASFLGSDSVSSVDWLDHFYYAAGSFVSGSVPATEHAVMCLGEKTTERETIRRIIQDVHPTGVVSVVADTWDFWNVISVTAAELKDVIMARQPNAIGLCKTVFRPDSGDPVKVLTGYLWGEVKDLERASAHEAMDNSWEAVLYQGKYYEFELKAHKYDDFGDCSEIVLGREVSEVEIQGAVEVLWNIFGGTVTDKGFRQLDQHVGLIYGDSITLPRAKAIMDRLVAKGFASGNVVLGIGSYTYQYMTRDTFGSAVKATWGDVGGVGREIFKDPVTDIGKVKKSAKGLLRVEKEGDNFVLYDQQTPEQERQGALQTVLWNGEFPNLVDWKQVRTVLGAVSLNV